MNRIYWSNFHKEYVFVSFYKNYNGEAFYDFTQVFGKLGYRTSKYDVRPVSPELQELLAIFYE